jgi:aspartokinase/homoserine dehydrogenase 1
MKMLYKFGGTSMGTRESMGQVHSLIEKELKNHSPMAVVLSAMSGITDILVKCCDLAASGQGWDKEVEQLTKRHTDAAKELLSKDNLAGFEKYLQQILQQTAKALNEVKANRQVSEVHWDLIAGQGEYLSSKLFYFYCLEKKNSVEWLDARDFLFIKHHPTGPAVDWERGDRELNRLLKAKPASLVIVPGFVASTLENVPTTLKRNGSDHSASIVGAMLKVQDVVIWTDVDGLMSADPRLVKEAVVLPEMSYLEALELAYFGAKVIHPRTMIPAMERGIRLWVKNTFNPTHPGTLIGPVDRSKKTGQQVVRGITSIADVSILTLEGAGMIGVPGIAEKVFRALKEEEISVVMIGQGSSEYSICLTIKTVDAAKAKSAVERAFATELSKRHINAVKLISDCAILAIVGEGMEYQEGVAATLFSSLARAQVSVRMIAQGSSEHNISVVIPKEKLLKALNVVHSAFYLSKLTLAIGLIGPGLIGKTFLRQLQNQNSILKDRFGMDMRLVGISNSKKMAFGSNLLSSWEQALDKGETTSLSKFIHELDQSNASHRVLIDCTSSEETGKHYAELLAKGIHIITPNKKANSGELGQYKKIQESVARKFQEKFLGKRGHYFYETTVGAALPVICTLQDLIKTGDKILKIEGVFSGTLSFIFNQLAKGEAFSSVVLQAKKLGYTEPDPRDDLSGLDVARKVVILARECGLDISLKDVAVEGLVSSSMTGLSVDDFLAALPKIDQEWKVKNEEARKAGESLRFVGSIDLSGKATVGVRRYKLEHPFSNLRGGENIIAFTTERYREYPLIIQGPGAGAEVTAGGVFADLIKVAELLRAAP